MVDHGLYIKADCTKDTFCMTKVSTLHGFTKGLSVDILYL